jgi:hypothetical protein
MSLGFGLHTIIHAKKISLIQAYYIGLNFFNFYKLNKQSLSFRIRSMRRSGILVINNHTRLVINIILNTKQVSQIITREPMWEFLRVFQVILKWFIIFNKHNIFKFQIDN